EPALRAHLRWRRGDALGRDRIVDAGGRRVRDPGQGGRDRRAARPRPEGGRRVGRGLDPHDCRPPGVHPGDRRAELSPHRAALRLVQPGAAASRQRRPAPRRSALRQGSAHDRGREARRDEAAQDRGEGDGMTEDRETQNAERPRIKITDKRRVRDDAATETTAPAPEAGASAPGPDPEGPEPQDAGMELEAARAETARYLDHLRRLQAEFDNYRKRVLKEQTQAIEM